jgi:putative membrane protein
MTALTQLPALAGHPGPYGYGGFHWWFLFFPFGFLFFWLLVALIFRSVLWRGRGGPWGGPGGAGRSWEGGTSAEQTLATRFAAGDIDEQEYRARLEVLRASPPNLSQGPR